MGALRDSIITTLIVKFFLKYATPYPTHLIIGILLVYAAYFQFHLKRELFPGELGW